MQALAQAWVAQRQQAASPAQPRLRRHVRLSDNPDLDNPDLAKLQMVCLVRQRGLLSGKLAWGNPG